MSDPIPFTIVDQTHTERINDKGALEAIWRITFQTPSGVRSFVDIPDQYYTAQTVHNWVSQKTATIEQVASLNGAPLPEAQ
jgi:hypothetical protein